jgi:hypothetical protein
LRYPPQRAAFADPADAPATLSVWIEATGWMDARARLCAGAAWPVFL